ncbi:MAG TPA: ArgE/DapE family deacylase [Sandaracinaceae bacterium LLY-WYZ-13_1]|nr:ArgE/DapE family deacylase [Sandaracinaceae bacterium LLY-WYZ-13_1]
MTENREALVDPERIRDRLVELIRIPSLGGEEEAAVARVADWLHDLGAEVDLWHDDQTTLQDIPTYPGADIARASVPVVAARLRGARPGPAVLLTGHIDVVPPGDPHAWTHDPYSGLVEGDRVLGRGASDMKSGVIAALEVMEAFAASHDFPGQVIFIAVPGEEDGGVGTFSAIERGWRGDVAVIPEPTSFEGRPRLVVAHAGAIIATLDVPGKSAHASTRLLGESALDHYVRLHLAIREHEKAVNDAEDHPLMKAVELPYAINPGIVNGGYFASSVMDWLSVELRVGVSLNETVYEAFERFEAAVQAAAAEDPWLRENPPIVRLGTRGFGSAQTPIAHPLVEALSEGAEKEFGARPVPRAAPYGCDMAGWVRLAGVPTVLYGPGDLAQAHAADEWVSLADTVSVSRVMTRAAATLLENGIPDAEGGASVIPG